MYVLYNTDLNWAKGCASCRAMAGPGAAPWATGSVDWTADEPLDVGAGNLFKTFPGRRCALVVALQRPCFSVLLHRLHVESTNNGE